MLLVLIRYRAKPREAYGHEKRPNKMTLPEISKRLFRADLAKPQFNGENLLVTSDPDLIRADNVDGVNGNC